MAKIEEIYVRKTRDELGRYPNWPVHRSISLGMIGFYYGKKANFQWYKSLSDLGINITSDPSNALINELYTSIGSVSFSFKISVSNTGSASFSFKKKFSVATQGYNVMYQALHLAPLEQELNTKIKNGSISWDLDWVILTEIWDSQAFTTLISGNRESSVEISTKKEVTTPIFNIADFSLGVAVSKSKAMSYQGIAEARIKPFFHIHRLIYDKKHKRYVLKRYGKN